MGVFSAVANHDEETFAQELSELCQKHDPKIGANSVVSILYSCAVIQTCRYIGVEKTQEVLEDLKKNVQKLYEGNEMLARLASGEGGEA